MFSPLYLKFAPYGRLKCTATTYQNLFIEPSLFIHKPNMQIVYAQRLLHVKFCAGCITFGLQHMQCLTAVNFLFCVLNELILVHNEEKISVYSKIPVQRCGKLVFHALFSITLNRNTTLWDLGYSDLCSLIKFLWKSIYVSCTSCITCSTLYLDHWAPYNHSLDRNYVEWRNCLLGFIS